MIVKKKKRLLLLCGDFGLHRFGTRAQSQFVSPVRRPLLVNMSITKELQKLCATLDAFLAYVIQRDNLGFKPLPINPHDKCKVLKSQVGEIPTIVIDLKQSVKARKSRC